MACSSPAGPEGLATPGERWSRRLLADLRDGGYRPRAWEAFLRASFDRAAQTQRARPGLVHQLDRWLTIWLAASVAARPVAAAGWLPRVPAGQELRWWAATAAMLRWHLGMVEGPHGEPRDRLRVADALALARVWAAPRLSRADRPGSFVALQLLVAAADAADGPLARRSGVTRLGRDLDRIADACASGAAVGAARRAGWIAPWASHAFALRYAVGVAYVTAHYFLQAAAPPATVARPAVRSAAAGLVTGLVIAARGGRRKGSLAVGGSSLAVLAAQGLAVSAVPDAALVPRSAAHRRRGRSATAAGRPEAIGA